MGFLWTAFLFLLLLVALVAVADRPAADDHAARLRGPLLLLLLSGGLLLWFSLAYFGRLPAPWRLPVLVYGTFGLLLTWLAGRLVSGRPLPPPLSASLTAAADWLGVRRRQLLLLALAPLLSALARPLAGDALLALDPWAATVSWVAGIGLVLLGGRRRDMAAAERPVAERPVADQAFGRDRPLLLAAGALFLLAFFLRAWDVTQLPTTFSGDEGSSGLIAARYLNGEANNLFTFGWFSFPSLYFALQSLGIAALGQTIAGLRISSALAGALGVVATLYLGRALYDRLTGLLAAAYLAVSHYHIHMSRIGLNNIWDSTLSALVLLGLWHGWRNNRRWAFLLAGAVLGLSQYFYVSVRVLPLLLLLWAGGALLMDRVRLRARLPDLFLAAWTALVVFLPLGLLFLDFPDDFQAPLQRVTVLGPWMDNEVLITGLSPLAIIGRQVGLTALGFTHAPLNLLYNPGAPLLLPGAATLFLIGLVWLLPNFDLRALLLLLPLAAVVLLGGLSQSAPASQRYVICIVPVAIILAQPLARAAQWLAEAWPARRMLVAGVVGLALVMIATADLDYYFNDVYDSYVLGGGNTVTATAIATYLQGEADSAVQVYFFGFPRMGYRSLSTIPYLVPDLPAEDVDAPLTAPPAWPLTGQTLFLFLPERLSELEQVRAAYPAGRYRPVNRPDGTLDFGVYVVPAP